MVDDFPNNWDPHDVFFHVYDDETRRILYEYGIVIPKGRSALGKAVKEIIAVEELPVDLSIQCKKLAQNLFSELLEIEEKISRYKNQLRQFDQDHHSQTPA